MWIAAPSLLHKYSKLFRATYILQGRALSSGFWQYRAATGKEKSEFRNYSQAAEIHDLILELVLDPSQFDHYDSHMFIRLFYAVSAELPSSMREHLKYDNKVN
jgi:hypothetical protein